MKTFTKTIQTIGAAIFLLICCHQTHAQGFYFGPKGGLVMGIQNWNGFERDALFAYHGDMLIESTDPNMNGSLFASLGYHVRGSATRVVNFNTGLNYTRGFRFYNVSMMLGAKRRIKTSGAFRSYYHVGIRGEYNVGTNFGDFNNLNTTLFFPIEELTNKFVYGISGGAGLEFEMSEFVMPYLEFTISPDLSFQYRQDAIPNVTNPYTGQPTTIPAREIRNLSLELSIGFKFLRKVIYVD